MTDELKITGLPDSWKNPPEDTPTLTYFNREHFNRAHSLKPICIAPSKGNMNYLYLSLYQAQYLLDELKKTIKAANKSIINDDDTLVVPFPKQEKENE